MTHHNPGWERVFGQVRMNLTPQDISDGRRGSPDVFKGMCLCGFRGETLFTSAEEAVNDARVHIKVFLEPHPVMDGCEKPECKDVDETLETLKEKELRQADSDWLPEIGDTIYCGVCMSEMGQVDSQRLESYRLWRNKDRRNGTRYCDEMVTIVEGKSVLRGYDGCKDE